MGSKTNIYLIFLQKYGGMFVDKIISIKDRYFSQFYCLIKHLHNFQHLYIPIYPFVCNYQGSTRMQLNRSNFPTLDDL